MTTFLSPMDPTLHVSCAEVQLCDTLPDCVRELIAAARRDAAESGDPALVEKCEFFLRYLTQGKPNWRMLKNDAIDPETQMYFCPYARCPRSRHSENSEPQDWKKTYDHVRYHFRSLHFGPLIGKKNAVRMLEEKSKRLQPMKRSFVELSSMQLHQLHQLHQQQQHVPFGVPMRMFSAPSPNTLSANPSPFAVPGALSMPFVTHMSALSGSQPDAKRLRTNAPVAVQTFSKSSAASPASSVASSPPTTPWTDLDAATVASLSPLESVNADEWAPLSPPESPAEDTASFLFHAPQPTPESPVSTPPTPASPPPPPQQQQQQQQLFQQQQLGLLQDGFMPLSYSTGNFASHAMSALSSLSYTAPVTCDKNGTQLTPFPEQLNVDSFFGYGH